MAKNRSRLAGGILPARRRVAAAVAALVAVSGARLPGALAEAPDFSADVKPLLRERCGDCHTANKRKGGFSLNTRDDLLSGSENGPVVEPGDAASSLLLELVATDDPDSRMPPKGDPLTEREVATLRAWIDGGLAWDEGFAFGDEFKPAVAFREVVLPPGDAGEGESHPIDRLMAGHWSERGVEVALDAAVDDRTFIRRASLDIVGLVPRPDEVDAYAADPAPGKRARLVRRLLDDRVAYADHWMTFWNDLLRNAYYGTGFIDGGRTQITEWLYRSLIENKPYDRFARELIGGAPGAEGYVKGIVWRGVVNASQLPVMQAAQNVSHVFLGTNLKCASCHDSFVDGWKLGEAYAFANVFTPDGRLEVVRCDKPTGELAGMALPFPELGEIDPGAPLAERLAATAAAIASPDNGLFARTIVNRLWKSFFGYGLVEPMDSMAHPSWHPELLEWLAVEFRDSGFDLQRVIELICTSDCYALPASATPAPKERAAEGFEFVFRGPWVRRLTAEQLLDAVAAVTGKWGEPTGADIEGDKGRGQGGQFLAMKRAQEAFLREAEAFDAAHDGKVPIDSAARAAALPASMFLRVMGRPSRDQVVVERETIATTLQALELTNGATFDAILREGAARWLADHPGASGPDLVRAIHRAALGRDPSTAEAAVADGLLGSRPDAEQVADYLWAVVMLPEFQLIH